MPFLFIIAVQNFHNEWYNVIVVNNIKGVDSMKKLDSIELLQVENISI